MSLVKRVALAFALLSTTSGCSWWASHGRPVEQALIDCAKQEASVAAIVGDVTLILDAGEASWKDALAAVGAKAGEDALACAVKVVEDALTPHGVAPLTTPPAADRAHGYIAERGWKFAP